MGGILTQPVTNKKSDRGEGLGLRYGFSSMQGWRPEMEDAHDIKVGLGYGLDDWSFFAVFDGHAGECAAGYAALNLLDYILDERYTGSLFNGANNDASKNSATETKEDRSQELEEDKKEQHQSLRKIIHEKLNEFEETMKQRWASSNTDQTPSVAAASTEAEADSSNEKPDSSKKDVSVEDKPEQLVARGDLNLEETNCSIDSKQEASSTLSNIGISDDTTGEAAKKAGAGNVERSLDEVIKYAKFFNEPANTQKESVKEAIKAGFLRIDQSMRTMSDMSGCTAVCALISPTHLFIANCGDSRAVLYDGDKIKFVTEDHKPYNPKERSRIISAGGTATQRINGTLAVSRALGDFEFKKDFHRGPCEQLVSPEPEVTIIEEHVSDEFLILACDGIWDVMTNEDICAFVKYMLQIEDNLETICSSVLDVCLRKGSRDNMSIIIVVLPNGPKVDEKCVEQAKLNDMKLLDLVDEVMLLVGPNVIDELSTLLEYMKDFIEKKSCYHIVPPGAGLDAKYDILKEKLEENLKKNSTSTPETKQEQHQPQQQPQSPQ